MAKRVAVIDIGSNSIRMVVYEKTSRYAFHLLYEEKSKVRISEDAYRYNGNLQEIPMQRTFDALSNFLNICNSFKVRKLLCVATSALRDAPNQKIFLSKVKDKLKLNIKIISGEKEAYFGAMACANLLPKQTNALSIDIGGGSTEFTFINDNSVSEVISLKLGTVRLKELYFDKNDIDGAVTYINSQLDKLTSLNIDKLVGIGGTFRAISTAIMKYNKYPLNKIHAYEYSADELKDYIKNILNTKNNEELKDLHIKNSRYDVIKPGVLILESLLNRLDSIKEVITSGVGVREGVYLNDLLRNSKGKFPHNYNTSVKYLLDTHVNDTTFSSQLNTLSKKIFDLTHIFFNIEKRYRYELALSAKLYPTGGSVHFFSQNKHTYYLIQNTLEYGFTHKSNTLIATLCKYAKSKLPTESHMHKYRDLLPQEKTTQGLSFILSLAISLLSHRPRNIDFDIEFKDGILTVISDRNIYITKEAIKKVDSPYRDFKVKISVP